MPPTVYWDVQWIKSDMYEKLWMVALPQIRCQLHDHAKQYDNDGACHNKRNVESCMAIYLRMPMEMPCFLAFPSNKHQGANLSSSLLKTTKQERSRTGASSNLEITEHIESIFVMRPFCLLWHVPSLSYWFAWSCSWHRICGKATVHNSFIHVTLDSLHIPVHRWMHLYIVIFCSKYRVVIVELKEK